MIKKNKSSNRNKYIDVDETLIKESSQENFDLIINNQYYVKNHKLIEEIKKEYSNGKFIVIWTANSLGEEWANIVVNALNLENFVDLTLFKPNEIIDDSPIDYWHHNFKKPHNF